MPGPSRLPEAHGGQHLGADGPQDRDHSADDEQPHGADHHGDGHDESADHDDSHGGPRGGALAVVVVVGLAVWRLPACPAARPAVPLAAPGAVLPACTGTAASVDLLAVR